jgi:non-specific serine/threonine protein kinase/serine/threonine-protein kinase
MTPERWLQIKELLGKALEMDSAARSGYLDQECGADADLRNDVERFLSAQGKAKDFLSAPPSLDAMHEERAQLDHRIGQFLGSYKLVGLIGEGGMGAVYRGIRADDQYDKEVAIKLVQAGHDSPTVMSRFRNERQILAGMDHPNVARLHDGGTTSEGMPYFVMELIEGEPINQYCDQHRLGIDARLKLFLDVCSAVEYAHRRLIVHRDIKPSNILVTSEGVPKLLDFGIAKIVDSQNSESLMQTAMSLRVFTPAYASPEQVQGDPITTASDVYSLGVVLYELLTGHHPYPLATSTPETLSRAICEQQPERLSSAVRRTVAGEDGAQAITPESVSAARECSPEKLSKRLRGDLDKIVLMSLRKEPERRYGSVEQFAEDIRRHLKNLPVSAHGDALGYCARKFARRHRAGITSAAVAVLALVMGTVVSVREARIARAERARAERRFNDVRQLANSLLFDVHDAIRDLPGSTAARKVLLDKALKYLDSLAGEAGNDPGLVRELATAYERVAEVQGHSLNDNLGDTGGSLRSYQKALALRQQLVTAPGSDWQDRLALANSFRAVASQLEATGQLSGALQAARNAIAASEFLQRERPTDLKVLDELSYDYEIEGHIEGGTMGIGLADQTGAMRSYQQAVEVDEAWLRLAPDDTRALHSYETDSLFLADARHENGNLQEALNDYNRALELAKTVSLRSASARRLRDVAVAYNRVGGVYEDQRNWQKALEQDEQALAIYRQLIDRDPNDFIMKQGFAIALANVGLQKNRITPSEGLSSIRQSVELMERIVGANKENAEERGVLASMYAALAEAYKRQHRLPNALREYQRVLDVSEELYAEDRKNKDALESVADSKASIGGILAALGKFQAASQSFCESLAALESVLAEVKATTGTLRIAADANASLAGLELRLGEGSSNASSQRKHWQKALELLLKSRDAWQKIPPSLRNAPTGPELSTAEGVRKQLEQCEKLLGNTELAMKH